MQITSISINPTSLPTERSAELISNFPTELTEKIFIQLTNLADRRSGACVCKEWNLSSSYADKMFRILKWPFGTDPQPKLPRLFMAPESSMPKLMKENIARFANQPCPLNPKKTLYETSMLVYLGSKILDSDKLEIPHSPNIKILNFDDDDVLKNTAAGTNAISKPKWMLIPKQPFGITNDHGNEKELNTEEMEKIEIAKAQGYRKMTALELGHGTFFGHFHELMNYEKPMDDKNAEYEKPWLLEPVTKPVRYQDGIATHKVAACEDMEKDGTLVESYIQFDLVYGTPKGVVMSKQKYEANAKKFVTGIMLGKEFEV